MFLRRWACLPVLSLICSAGAIADDGPAVNLCQKPPPLAVTPSREERDQFQQALERYRDCVEQYIKQENDAARRHADAADDARKAFNTYVQQINEEYGSHRGVPSSPADD